MKLPVILCLSLLLAVNLNGQRSRSQTQLRTLDSLTVKDVPAGAPGIATAIIQNGQVIYEHYAGYADLSDSTLIDSTTRFNIASNGKQFTALAVNLLVQDGLLSLNDDIRQYLPGLFPSIQDTISIRHLLTHTSGIRDVYDLWSLQGLTWWEHNFGNAQAYQVLNQQQDLNFAPGEDYLYSNSNYILLALIVEAVSGKTFRAYTDEMFVQLDMPHTSFETDHQDIAPPIARSYFNFGSWTTYDWIWDVVGDGNLYTTLPDQIAWEKRLQATSSGDTLYEALTRSQQQVPGSDVPYGYGLEFGTYKGVPYRFHEGATGAAKATFVRFTAPNLSFLTLTNTGKAVTASQTRQLVDVLLELPAQAADLVTEPRAVGEYVSEEDILGTYLTPSNYSFELLKDDNGVLQLNRIGRGYVELEREADNIFHQKYDPAFKQEFTVNDMGEMVVTAYYTTHAPYSLTRANVDWADYDFTLLEGVYLNRETGVTFNIEHEADKRYRVTRSGSQASTGQLVAPHKLLVDNYVIEAAEPTVKPMSIRVSYERVRDLEFVRVAK